MSSYVGWKKGNWELWGEWYASDGVWLLELLGRATYQKHLHALMIEEERSCMYRNLHIVSEGTYEYDDEEDS